MFPRRMSLLEVRMSCRIVSSCRYVPMLPLKMSRCLANAVHSPLNFLVLVVVSGAVSLSQVDVAFNLLHLCFVFLHTLIFTFINQFL